MKAMYNSLLAMLSFFVIIVFTIGCEDDRSYQSLSPRVNEQAIIGDADSSNEGDVIEPEETEDGNSSQPEPTGEGSDEIPLSDIRWLDTDVSSWPVTSKLEVRLDGKYIVYEQDGTGKWPSTSVNGGDLTGNPWVFIQQADGTWYAATDEWMRPGQKVKAKYHVNGAHIKEYSHIPESWQPTPGVVYGFMVSGLARTSDRNVQERTQIVLMKWE
jgi:hypothetical protein